MQTQEVAVIPDGPKTGLQELMAQLVQSLLPVATSNKSFFINDIPRQLQVSIDREMLASILSGVLSSVIIYARDSCIRLSVRMDGDRMLLQVRGSASSKVDAVAREIRRLQPITEKMMVS